jgi:hypothetical protein
VPDVSAADIKTPVALTPDGLFRKSCPVLTPYLETPVFAILPNPVLLRVKEVYAPVEMEVISGVVPDWAIVETLSISPAISAVFEVGLVASK